MKAKKVYLVTFFIISEVFVIAVLIALFMGVFDKHYNKIGNSENVMIVEMVRDGVVQNDTNLTAPLVDAFAECKHVDSIAALQTKCDEAAKIYGSNLRSADGYVCDVLPYGLSALKLEMDSGDGNFEYNGRSGVIVPASLVKQLWRKQNHEEKYICWNDHASPMVQIVGIYKDLPKGYLLPNAVYHTACDRYAEDHKSWKFRTFIRIQPSKISLVEKELNTALRTLMSASEDAKAEYEGMKVKLVEVGE